MGLSHISTGIMIRAAMRDESEAGDEIRSYVNDGRLVPGRLVRMMAEDAMEQAGVDDFVLDGYPRTLEQATWLDAFLEERDKSLETVLSLYLPDERIIARLSRRRVHRETGVNYHLDFNPPPPDVPPDMLLQRTDDRAEAIKKRLDVYRESTLPLEEYFRAQGKLVRIDAVGTVEDVHERIRSAIARRVVNDEG